jgi:hypothetical protein
MCQTAIISTEILDGRNLLRGAGKESLVQPIPSQEEKGEKI